MAGLCLPWFAEYYHASTSINFRGPTVFVNSYGIALVVEIH